MYLVVYSKAQSVSYVGSFTTVVKVEKFNSAHAAMDAANKSDYEVTIFSWDGENTSNVPDSFWDEMSKR